MKNTLLLSLIFILTLLVSSCESSKTNKLILDEPFNDNEIGWIEESTSSHILDIVDGYYRISSRDSMSSRTSRGRLLSNYLVNLPSEYSIESSIKLTESENEDTHFGIILLSPSLEYCISIYSTGWV